MTFMNSEKRGEVDSAPYEGRKKLETPAAGAEREEATVRVVQAEPEGEKTQGGEEEKKAEAPKTGVATDGKAEEVAATEDVAATTQEVAATEEAATTQEVAATEEAVTVEELSSTVEEAETTEEAATVEELETTEEAETTEGEAAPAEVSERMRKKAKGKSNERAAHVGNILKKKKYKLFSKQKPNKNKKKKKKEPKDKSKKKDREKLPTTFLLPGVGGSTLIAEYKNALIHSCSNNLLNSKPFRIWISLTRLFSITSNVYCTFDTLRLLYDNEKKMYFNQPGVNITVENYGRLKGIDYLDYINNTGIGGYVDGESIMGAPYDWRYPLHQQDYNLFKDSIEAAYERRNGMKVNVVGHSLGGLFINYFLVHIVDKEWKQKYLSSIMYMSSPFKGTVKTIRALLHGNRDFVSFKIKNLIKLSISDSMMKAIGNSVGSLFDLIPYKEYYDHDQVVIIMNTDPTPIDKNNMQSIVTTCGIYNKDCYLNRTDVKLKVYTLSDWHVLLKDDLREKYNNHKQYRERHFSMDHGVPIYCVYSTLKNKSTDYLLFFQKENLNEEPDIYYGIGDGTVPIESLEACNNFYNATEKKHFENYSHIGILHNADTVKYVYDSLQTIGGNLDDVREDVTAKVALQGSVEGEGKEQMLPQGSNGAENELSKVPQQGGGNGEMTNAEGQRAK
ncbi:phosphatidylcholine-sterol acyltransferase precursor [Plasmodium cynomolgi strain B]|uniref:Phosphatidylcholine-sterol acyltransferase n=1 Tax=Plasmodium cynomolgi (strain B) TaxID=1120755 RepID=K6UDV6_PLACD|nr:phosphatidylcholine-sterol acyltransferase precursor [Plasmodium cynomolgi strain B]GAB67266.1 phosphatidylcholine-sterol acyltransferase precursor [Plasmodium cynomolgi strain B]